MCCCLRLRYWKNLCFKEITKPKLNLLNILNLRIHQYFFIPPFSFLHVKILFCSKLLVSPLEISLWCRAKTVLRNLASSKENDHVSHVSVCTARAVLENAKRMYAFVAKFSIRNLHPLKKSSWIWKQRWFKVNLIVYLWAHLFPFCQQDLIFYLQSKKIDCSSCIEKEELVNMIVNHVNSNSYYETGTHSSSSTTPNIDFENYAQSFDQIKQTCQNLFSSISDKISSGN